MTIPNDAPVSERFRLAALKWTELDNAARMLEEGKTTYLAQQKTRLGDMPEAKSERIVKSSKEWSDYIKAMVRSKTAANKARIEMDYLKMRMQEWIAAEANNRVERKM